MSAPADTEEEEEEVRTELRGDREQLRTEEDSPQQINVSLTLICETNILRIFRKRWISDFMAQ